MNQTTKRMARKVKHINWSSISPLLMVTVLALAGCGTQETEAQADGQQAGEGVANADVRVINVEVTEVSLGNFTDYIRVIGQTEALLDVVVSAEESGAVREIVRPKGSRVQQGDTIIRLDNSILLAMREEARASANLALEQFERQRQLWEEDSLGTEIAYLQAKYQSDIAAARILQLDVRLEATIIYAPVSGVFDEQFIELGELATVGAPVVRVVSASRLKVVAGIPERYAPFVRVGNSAEVSFDVLPGDARSGRINFVGASVNESNRTFPIEVLIDNPGGFIKPHMVADLQVTRRQLVDVVTVPQEVVIRTATGYKVFVVEEADGIMVSHARPVVLGDNYNNRVVIEEGLAVGDMLVTLGAQLVDDGSRVNVVRRDGQFVRSE